MVKLGKVLIEHGAHVDCRDKNHWTPLHVASKNSQVEVRTTLPWKCCSCWCPCAGVCDCQVCVFVLSVCSLGLYVCV